MKDATLASAREDDGDVLAKAKDDWAAAGTAGFDGRSVVGVRHQNWLLAFAGHSGWTRPDFLATSSELRAVPIANFLAETGKRYAWKFRVECGVWNARTCIFLTSSGC